MSWTDLLGRAAGLFKTLAGVGSEAETIAPAIGKSVTFVQIMDGLDVARALPWADIAAAANAQFRDPLKDAVAVEEIAQAVANTIPAAATPAVTVEDIASAIVVLCQLGVITWSGDGKAPPRTAIPDAPGTPHAPPAPFI